MKSMATEKEQPTTEEELIFEWAPGVPIDDGLMENKHQLDEKKMRQKLNKISSPQTMKQVTLRSTQVMIC